MTKIPRTCIEGALYYLTARGDHGEDIFKEQKDYEAYIELLNKYKERYGFKLYAFCLLPNHLHLAIEIKSGTTISDIMHDLNSNYTRYFNARYRKKGHLLQERHKSVLLEKKSYLLILTAYIHLNPKVLNLAAYIKDYPYSSYPLYMHLNAEKIDLREEIQEIKSFLGEKSYEGFVENVPQNEVKVLDESLRKEVFLGTQEFIRKINEALESKEKKTGKIAGSLPGRSFVLWGSIAILCLAVVTALLCSANKYLRIAVINLSKNKEAEYSKRLNMEIKNVKKDLTELYSADIVSYHAMAKRLEIEKKKNRQIQEKTD